MAVRATRRDYLVLQEGEGSTEEGRELGKLLRSRQAPGGHTSQAGWPSRRFEGGNRSRAVPRGCAAGQALVVLKGSSLLKMLLLSRRRLNQPRGNARGSGNSSNSNREGGGGSRATPIDMPRSTNT